MTPEQINALSADEKMLLCQTVLEDPPDEGYTALMVAMYNEDYPTAEALLQGLSPTQRYALCLTPTIKGHLLLTFAINSGDTQSVSLLLKDFSPIQKNELCTRALSAGYFKGFTALTLAITKNDTRTATTLLDELSVDQRMALCKTQIADSKYRGNTALTLATLYCQGSAVTALLLNNLPEAELDALLQMNLTASFEGSNTELSFPMIECLALMSGYRTEPLQSCALRHGFNVGDIFQKALDLSFNFQTGLQTALLNGISPTFLSAEELDRFLLREDKPLAEAIRALLPVFERNASLRDTAAAWLDGLTPDEKRAALTALDDGVENAMIVQAFERGQFQIVGWLIGQGIVLPQRFHEQADRNGIQYGQSIHNAAVHHTVGESLIALKKVKPLSDEEIEAALKGLKDFADTLQDSNDNTNEEAVAKRALARITAEEYLQNKESRSEVSVAEMLAYFFIALNKLEKREEKKDALAVFYNQLFITQRDYSADNSSSDSSICVGGTLNQLAIALGAVYPEQVWIVFVNNQTLALDGLNALPNIISKAYAEAAQKIAFAKMCESCPEAKVIPDNLWPTIEADLRKSMKETLFNRKFNPPRAAMPESEMESMINAAILILKTGTIHPKFSIELNRPKEHLSVVLSDIAKSNGDQNTFKKAVLMRAKHSNEAVKSAKGRYGLDEAQKKLDDEKNAPPKSVQVSNKELYLRSCSTTLSPFPIETMATLCKKYKVYAAAKGVAENLPESFKKLAADSNLLEQILNLLNGKRHNPDKTIYLDDVLRASPDGKAWLDDPEDIEKTMLCFTDKKMAENQNLDEYLRENSVAIYQALFFLAPEMLRNSLKAETAKAVKIAQRHVPKD
jgi:ankyrin repeat protein